MLHREERGNPYNYFEKTFREYQNGFERNGMFFAVQNSSIVDLVTDSLTVLLLLTYKE